MKVVLAGILGAAVVAVAPPEAQPRSAVAITQLRVITADTRRPARPPFDRRRAYAYMVRYRIGGPGALTVRRRALVRTRAGTVMARILPPLERDEAGSYFASARIPIGRRDPRGIYILRYEITVRGHGGPPRRAVRAIRLRFR